MHKVLIGLVSYNDLAFLQESLPVLEELRLNLPADVVVMENAGNKEVQAFVKKEFPKFELVKSKENLGYGASYSKILNEHPGHKYFLLVTSDVFLDVPVVKQFVQRMEKDSELAMCAGKLHHWDLENHRRTEIIDSLGIMGEKRHHFVDRGHGEVDSGQYDDVLGDAFGISGAVFMLRTSVVEKLGGELFEPRMWMYKEDIDLAYRLRWLDEKIQIFPEVWGWHARSVANKEGQSLGALARADKGKRDYGRAHSYKNHILLLKNHVSWRYGLRVLSRIAFYEFMKGGYMLVRYPKVFFGGMKTLFFVRARRSDRLISAKKMLSYLN